MIVNLTTKHSSSIITVKGKNIMSKQKLIQNVVSKIRHDWGAADAKRDSGKKTPEDILRFEKGLFYLRLDIFWLNVHFRGSASRMDG